MIETQEIERIRAVILAEAEKVRYEPDPKHRYFFDDDDAEVPGVSKLLRPITDEEMRGIPPDVLEAARQRGTDAHAAIDKYLATGWSLSSGDMALYMKQFKRFMDEHKVIVIAHECKVRNYVYGVAGRTDLIANMDEEPVIRPFDYKFTYEVNPSVVLQLNMYEACLYSYKLDGKPLPVGEGCVVWFSLDDYKLIPASEIADRDLTVATARGLVNVNTFRDRYCKRK